MAIERKEKSELSIEDLDRELIARAAQIPENKLFKFRDKEGTPERDAIVAQLKELYDPATSPSPDEALRHVCTEDLIKILKNMTWKEIKRGARGIWYGDARMDFYDITDGQIKENANSVAAICTKDNLIDDSRGFSILRVKNYWKTLNLCDSEPFHHQPIAVGRMTTGFLVAEDIIATAPHSVRESNVTDIRIVFGFKMEDPYTPVTRVPNENIYKGVEVIHRMYRKMKGNESDWALVKLDRKVEGRSKVMLSRKRIFCDQSIYVIGYPVGLPLKYAPGGRVLDINKAYFSADLDVYSDNAGSPVFNSDTHEVIGMVLYGDRRDFRWTGKCWTSVIYPRRNISSKGVQCTRISELIEYNNENNTDIDTSNSIFISYSHKDKKYLERLMVHLRPLQKKGIIDIWVDTKLKPGDKWKIEIENALKRARVAIILVSADFLASRFIVDNELPPLLQKAGLDGTRIIPVIVKPCRFPRDENLSMFQSINEPSKPIIKLSSAEREKIYDRISNEIEALMQKKGQ